MLERNEWLTLALGLCLGFLLCGTVYSAMWDIPSQRPAPGPSESRHQQQTQAGEAQRAAAPNAHGTEESPFVVKVLPAPNADEIAREIREREDDKATNDRIIAYASVALAVFTFLLFIYTAGLFRVTSNSVADAQKAAARVRSIIRGAGTNLGGPAFQIEARNSGDGPAVIRRIYWRFATFGDYTPQPFEDAPSGEVIASRERAKPVKIVPVPGVADPMIVFRFEYFDVNRRAAHVIEHAMRLAPPRLPGIPIFVDTPDGFLTDTFPVDSGTEIET